MNRAFLIYKAVEYFGVSLSVFVSAGLFIIEEDEGDGQSTIDISDPLNPKLIALHLKGDDSLAQTYSRVVSSSKWECVEREMQIFNLRHTFHTSVVLPIFLLTCVSGSIASSYFVAKSGNDNASGGNGAPFATIQKAASVMVAGDSCYIAGGTYGETVLPASLVSPSSFAH